MKVPMVVVVLGGVGGGGGGSDDGGVRIRPESFPRKKSATWKVFAFSTSAHSNSQQWRFISCVLSQCL